MLASMDLPPPVDGLLKSAFPVRDEWLEGASEGDDFRQVDVDGLARLLEGTWDRLVADLAVEQPGQNGPLDRNGVLRVDTRGVVASQASAALDVNGRRAGRRQLIRAELRSAGIDGVTFLRCSSEIGLIDLSDVKTIDRLRRLQLRLGQPRLCVRYHARQRKYALSVEASLPFDAATTQYEEIRELVSRVALQADRIEDKLLGVDAEPVRLIEGFDRA